MTRSIKKLIPLSLAIIASCTSKQKMGAISDTKTAQPAESIPEPEQEEQEAVVPTPVTGSYLVCQQTLAEAPRLDIACRILSEEGASVNLENVEIPQMILTNAGQSSFMSSEVLDTSGEIYYSSNQYLGGSYQLESELSTGPIEVIVRLEVDEQPGLYFVDYLAPSFNLQLNNEVFASYDQIALSVYQIEASFQASWKDRIPDEATLMACQATTNQQSILGISFAYEPLIGDNKYLLVYLHSASSCSKDNQLLIESSTHD